MANGTRSSPTGRFPCSIRLLQANPPARPNSATSPSSGPPYCPRPVRPTGSMTCPGMRGAARLPRACWTTQTMIATTQSTSCWPRTASFRPHREPQTRMSLSSNSTKIMATAWAHMDSGPSPMLQARWRLPEPSPTLSPSTPKASACRSAEAMYSRSSRTAGLLMTSPKSS